MFKSGFVVDSGDQHAVVVEAIAHTTTVKGDMFILEMGTSGLTTAAVPNAGQIVQCCIAAHDIASEARGKYYIAGTCEVLNKEATTAGHGLEIDNSLAGAGDSSGAVTTIRGEAQTTAGVWLATQGSTGILVKAFLHGGLTTVAS